MYSGKQGTRDSQTDRNEASIRLSSAHSRNSTSNGTQGATGLLYDVYNSNSSSSTALFEHLFDKSDTNTDYIYVDNGLLPHWSAPEVIMNEYSYTQQSDIYSLGMVLYELYSKRVPFEDVMYTTNNNRFQVTNEPNKEIVAKMVRAVLLYKCSLDVVC